VLGEQYGGSPDSRLPRDLEQVGAWVRGGREPASVTEAAFVPARLNSMTSRNSAAYKGVLALLLRQGCVDWTYTKEPIDATIFADQQVDLTLIFPKAWCDKNGIGRERDSIVNKTPLANRTRRVMGNHGPDVYLGMLEAEAGVPGNWLDDIVTTHLVDPDNLRGRGAGRTGALRMLRKTTPLDAGNFATFYMARSDSLLKLIREAAGLENASAVDDSLPGQPV
jgi:hypothetical protein